MSFCLRTEGCILGGMKNSVSDRIRIVRITRNLSQENLAEELGLSVGAYSNIETGKTKISIERLRTIAHILGAPVSAFLDDSDLPTNLAVSTEGSTRYLELVVKIEQLTEGFNDLKLLFEAQKLEIDLLKKAIPYAYKKGKGKSQLPPLKGYQ